MSDRYDPGLLNDFGGGNVDWWWDYIRAEVDRCNEFHADILEAAVAAARAEGMREAARIGGDAAVAVLLRHEPDASLLRQQATRQAIAVPIFRAAEGRQ